MHRGSWAANKRVGAFEVIDPAGGSCTGGTNGPCGSCPCALKFTVPTRELGAAPICSSPCESSGALALAFIACGGAWGAWLR